LGGTGRKRRRKRPERVENTRNTRGAGGVLERREKTFCRKKKKSVKREKKGFPEKKDKGSYMSGEKTKGRGGGGTSAGTESPPRKEGKHCFSLARKEGT